MTRLTQRTLLATCTLALSLLLNACGGGEETPAPATPQTITFASPGNQVFATTPALLVATSTSGLSVAFASSTPAVCTVSTATLTLVGAGTCTLSASQPGNTTFLAALPVTQSFSVLPAAQTITFISPGNQALGVAPAPLVASATSGLSVVFVSTTPAVCSANGSTLSLLAVGTCTVSASQAGNANYNAATPVVQSFMVAAAMTAQTITFASPGDQTLGVTPAALAATASSGLAVSLESTTPAVCTVSGSTLSLLSFGTCTVAASQAGDANFAAAAAVLRTFNVAAIAQTINFTSPGGQTLGSTAPALRASATSGLAVAFMSTTPAVCDAAGTTLTLLATGTCTIAASQAGNSTFAAAAPVLQSFAVAAAAQSITFNSPGNQTLGLTPAALVATSTSGLPVSFASSTTSVCTVSGTTLTLVAAGTCSVSASQPGNASFAAAATVSNAFSVAALTQSISFVSPGNQTLGVAPAALVASASSGLTVSFTSSTTSVCTVNGSTLTLLSAGTCTLSAVQPGNATVAAATPVTNSFTVAPAAQTITFAALPGQTLGTAAPQLVATATSGLPVSFISATQGVCTVGGNTLTLVAAGTCTINASQPGNANFVAAAVVSRSFSVAPAPLGAQTITFNSPGNQTLGTAPPALVASSTSGLTVSLVSTTQGVCTVNGTALTLVAVGTCSIDASQPGNASFAPAAVVSRSFSVAPAPLSAQTITFNSPGNQTLGTAPPALVASSTSGLTVSLVSTTQGVCTVNGTTLTLVAVGTCSIDASQPGNASFAPAAVVSRSFSVAPAPLIPQTITFNSPGNQTLGTAPPALVASSTSGLTVSLGSTTQGVCTVSGTTLSLVAVGTCTIEASQPGNATFAAATVVSLSFAVAPAPLAAQTITFSAPGNQTLGTTPAALVASSTSGLTVLLASTTTGVCTVSGTTLTLMAVGSCTITANQAGNGSFAPAPTVSQTFSVAAAPLGAELMANGGFETANVLSSQFAAGWRGVNSRPATLSNDARTGLRSAAMAVPDPGFGGSGLVQNAVDDGGLASILGLHVGKTTVLTFWAKGNASITGNVNFSLRYLNATGVILNPVINTSFGSRINATTWTLITLNGPAIPSTTSAIFLEMTLAVGPTGPTINPDGSFTDYGQAVVLIDDVSVRVVP